MKIKTENTEILFRVGKSFSVYIPFNFIGLIFGSVLELNQIAP